MEKPFDIFWFGEAGPNWVKAVESLESAKNHIESMPDRESGSYVILDQKTGKQIPFLIDDTSR
jgi:hypothetical protein